MCPENASFKNGLWKILWKHGQYSAKSFGNLAQLLHTRFKQTPQNGLYVERRRTEPGRGVLAAGAEDCAAGGFPDGHLGGEAKVQ